MVPILLATGDVTCTIGTPAIEYRIAVSMAHKVSIPYPYLTAAFIKPPIKPVQQKLYNARLQEATDAGLTVPSLGGCACVKGAD